MDSSLDTAAVRVLGSLIEKEITTPDNYPLTLNALVAACNQASNRDPVLALDETTVARTIEDLRRRSLVRAVQKSESRTLRYRHLVPESMSLGPAESAVMCVLMLRGAQTAGELKSRTSRLYEFSDLAQVDATLEALISRAASPLVARLPRRAGQKEVRYAHLLSGEPTTDATDNASLESAETQRIEVLEQSVDALRGELAELRARFEDFRREFQ